MDKIKKQALEAAGWKFGDAEDFLNKGRAMNEQSYTPGPWVIPSSNVFRVVALRDGEPYRVIVSDTGPAICSYGQKQIGWLGLEAGAEAAANARLIAAAPEMFELLVDIDNRIGEIDEKAWNKLQEIIKRVRYGRR